MRADLQHRIQRYGWDRAAAVYERHWSEQLRPAQDATLRLAALRPGERVIDVACGTGLVTLRAAHAVGTSGRTVGTDLSEGMLRPAREAAAKAGLAAEFLRTEAGALTFPAGSFDVGLCVLGLMYVPDPVRALAELKRVLAPGGRAAVAVWGARERCGWSGVFPIVDARVRTEVCPLFFSLGTGDALRRCFEDAGFREVTVERLATRLAYANADDACAAAFAGGPVALAYSRFDSATREEAHREYLESIEPFRRGERYEVIGEFVVAVAR